MQLAGTAVRGEKDTIMIMHAALLIKTMLRFTIRLKGSRSVFLPVKFFTVAVATETKVASNSIKSKRATLLHLLDQGTCPETIASVIADAACVKSKSLVSLVH